MDNLLSPEAMPVQIGDFFFWIICVIKNSCPAPSGVLRLNGEDSIFFPHLFFSFTFFLMVTNILWFVFWRVFYFKCVLSVPGLWSTDSCQSSSNWSDQKEKPTLPSHLPKPPHLPLPPFQGVSLLWNSLWSILSTFWGTLDMDQFGSIAVIILG